jgi:hypothetical protein
MVLDTCPSGCIDARSISVISCRPLIIAQAPFAKAISMSISFFCRISVRVSCLLKISFPASHEIVVLCFFLLRLSLYFFSVFLYTETKRDDIP